MSEPTMTPGRALAQWWAEQLGSPRFDNGDSEGLAGMLGTIAVGPGGLTEEQTMKFVEHLAAKIDADLERMPQYGVTLSVDYGPCRDLAEAADAAEINISRFPWKTLTRATTDYVTVSPGYGAMSSLHWSREGWERPACGSGHYARRGRGDYERLPEACGLPLFHEERECGAWVPRQVTDA